MAEEPSLPALPAVSWNGQSETFTKGSRKRLRPVHPNTGTTAPGLYNSSDPAVFSSDDDPGLDNYVGGRRKRKYVGSWYQQFPTSSDSTFSEVQQVLPRPKRALRRQLDSGVFLGSDGATDNESVPGVIDLPIHSKFPRIERPPVPTFSEPELVAQEKIRECLEQGNESIDFWSMGLDDISNETLMPLAQLSCIPQVARDVAFEQKDPELKIYLARNRLRRLPGSLFDLAFLTVLSLRDNKLSDIPASIAKLTNLRELNLAQNKLRTLPLQLLDLIGPTGRLKKLMLFPNPFAQPDRAIGDVSGDGEMDAHDYVVTMPIGSMRPSVLARFLGQTPLQLTTSKGRQTSKFKLSFDAGKLPVEFARQELEASGEEVILEGSDDAVAEKQSRVPSLVEAALRSCYRIPKPESLAQYIPDEMYQLRDLVTLAGEQKHSGGLVCSTCRKHMVMPAVEWVEWRDLRTCYWLQAGGGRDVEPGHIAARLIPLSRADGEIAVPFLHQSRPVSPSPSQLPPVPSSPVYSIASTANPISQYGLPLPPPPRPAHAVLTKADLERSQAAYADLVASAKAYRQALATLSTAASAFGTALESCARLKEARAEPIGGSRAGGRTAAGAGAGGVASMTASFVATRGTCTADTLMAASGLQHLVANHQQILSETVYRSFEVPLLHDLDRWRSVIDDEEATYQQQITAQAREVRRLEKDGLRLHRQRRRDVARFRAHLVELTGKLDGMSTLHADHARTMLRESQETSARIVDASCSLVRAEVDIFESLAKKGWTGGGLEDLLEKGQDLFAADAHAGYAGGGGGGSGSDGVKLFSILPPKSILADAAGSDSGSRAGGHARSDSLLTDPDRYQSLTALASDARPAAAAEAEAPADFNKPRNARPFSPQPIRRAPMEITEDSLGAFTNSDTQQQQETGEDGSVPGENGGATTAATPVADSSKDEEQSDSDSRGRRSGSRTPEPRDNGNILAYESSPGSGWGS
ncbi:Leucine Rich Repeat domain protein [Cordyceps fumosorosea ARSEF 2679]|uniref:Leucine Rich Repeat domain protein n=1 Tax=Cordyceps fumosorosea (strain ARSEF 2679) TaxID=1081104 RepID=A0A167MYU5_CORFA|nr:Leucine Rich Repeat domain protein [Cordyceps fumosorosea ARSEF 2679]OAA54922.1 Leucine Rich Repeat domain protein [Cordyceps fumosorosea ARSEF 2679]